MRAALSRRDLLISGFGSTSLWLGLGCRWQARVGDAYAPWDFDPSGERPEVGAAMAAILAANPHNSQPWLFRIEPGFIDLFADLGQSLGAMDPAHREMHIGLGCAVENLSVAARALGRAAAVTLMPDPSDETHVAHVALTEAAPEPSALFDAIPLRHTNRGPYEEGVALPRAFREALLSSVEGETRAHLWEDDATMAEIRERCVAATEAIVADQEMNEASHAWWRQDPEDIEAYRTGLTMDATGSSGCTRAMGKHLANPDADRAGAYWVKATDGRQGTASAWVLLATPLLEDRVQQLEVGRSYQRMHLLAESEGYAMQPLNQALERRDRERFDGREGAFGPWLGSLSPGEEAQMLFRVGIARRSALPSPRAPLDWVEIGSTG